MYHHRILSCMSDSIRRGIMSHSITRRRVYQLTNATTPPPMTHNPLFHSSSSSSTPAVCTNRFSRFSSSSFSLGAGDVATPCLFLSPASKGNIIPVFNPSDRRFYDLPIPKEVQGPNNSVCGAGQGWLLMAKSKYDMYEDEAEENCGHPDRIVSLYNPITRTHIPLPDLPPSLPHDGQVWCNPAKASHGQPLVSIIYGWQLLVYHQGEKSWSFIESPSRGRIASTAYQEAEATLYVVHSGGELSVLDLTTLSLRPVIDTPSPKIESLRGSLHLVVGAAGDLLLVEMNLQWNKQLGRCNVFKLDRRCLKWVRTTNMGNHTLFMYGRDQVISTACDPAFADAHANQIYHFLQYRARPKSENRIEMPAIVRVRGRINRKKQLFFKTTNILAGNPWYQQFAAWMVPSHK